MYEDNGNTKVTLVVISMGGPVSLYFLTQVVNQEWKDMYIHAYISLAAVWAGGFGILTAALSPPPAGSFALYPQASAEDVLSVFHSFASTLWLIPRESAFKDITIVSTSTRNYTSRDYQDLFTDIGFPEGYTIVSQNNLDFPAPNVSTYCFYGLGFPTPLSYVYNGSYGAAQPTTLFGDGDISVNKESLEVCQNWADSGYPFNRTVFPGVNHAEIISNEAVLNAIQEIVGAPVDQINSAPQLSALYSLSGLMIVVLLLHLVF